MALLVAAPAGGISWAPVSAPPSLPLPLMSPVTPVLLWSCFQEVIILAPHQCDLLEFKVYLHSFSSATGKAGVGASAAGAVEELELQEGCRELVEYI